MTKLGIMEGRLVPPEPGRFQSFPRSRWADEFELASHVPLSYIEWIYDGYGADVNPLLHDASRLKELIDSTGVAVRSVCADYFMDYPFVRCTGDELAERRTRLDALLDAAHDLGIGRVVIPFVDASRIETPDDLETVIEVLRGAAPVARTRGVELHLETSLGPREFRDLLDRVPDPVVKVNYDTGNSSSLGFHPAEEFAAYGERIGSVHVKDRVFGGSTVPLGSGDADFPAIFDGLGKLGYSGDITLQVARSAEIDEVSWARANRAFVERYWPVE